MHTVDNARYIRAGVGIFVGARRIHQLNLLIHGGGRPKRAQNAIAEVGVDEPPVIIGFHLIHK